MATKMDAKRKKFAKDLLEKLKTIEWAYISNIVGRTRTAVEFADPMDALHAAPDGGLVEDLKDVAKNGSVQLMAENISPIFILGIEEMEKLLPILNEAHEVFSEVFTDAEWKTWM